MIPFSFPCSTAHRKLIKDFSFGTSGPRVSAYRSIKGRTYIFCRFPWPCFLMERFCKALQLLAKHMARTETLQLTVSISMYPSHAHYYTASKTLRKMLRYLEVIWSLSYRQAIDKCSLLHLWYNMILTVHISPSQGRAAKSRSMQQTHTLCSIDLQCIRIQIKTWRMFSVMGES